MTLRETAPGKVNLCLFLGPTLGDGRHELVTLIESVTLADELRLTVLEDGDADEVVCPGLEGPNLVSRALEGLRARGWDAPPVRVEIRKRVPVAAGMGGGSADAAAVLRIAQRLAPIPQDLLAELAAELGADVPSQLAPGLVLGVGAGDLVEPVAALAPHAFVIVPQPFELSTAEVYREADRLGLPRQSLAGLRERLLDGGAELPSVLLVNDLEPASRSLCPAIDGALDAIRETGSAATFVCGSGPTCAGLWWGEQAPAFAEAAATALRGAFPAAEAVGPIVAAQFGLPR
jgi:4-diphosphocytidyl-2-C-methyl-D-erythritol kinase